MSDILERLRGTDPRPTTVLLDEAAAEITRLKDELAAAERLSEERRVLWREAMSDAVAKGRQLAAARKALRAAMYDAPGWYDLARAALAGEKKP